MNFRNKKLVNVLRTLFGLFMAFSGLSGLWMVVNGSLQGIPENMVPITNALLNSGIFYMIKITESVAGLMLVFNFLPALAAIFIAPIAVGIIVFHIMTSPSGLPIGIIIALLNIYLGYVYWDKYKVLFKS